MSDLDKRRDELKKRQGEVYGVDFAAGVHCGFDACRELMGWQPIETAPKDGTEILIYTRFEDVFIACYNKRSLWHGDFGEMSTSRVTQWAPLPESPEER